MRDTDFALAVLAAAVFLVGFAAGYGLAKILPNLYFNLHWS